jgi:hypothetical protein
MKIVTLIVAVGLFTTAAFAQDSHHSNDNRYQYSYLNQYAANSAYRYAIPYSGNWNRTGYGNKHGYKRYDRCRHEWIMDRD